MAQSKLAFAQGLDWFDAQDQMHQAAILTVTLPMLLPQAHRTALDVARALETAPINASMTPVVLLQPHPFAHAMQKVLALPVTEWREAFIVCLSIFQAADTHRREPFAYKDARMNGITYHKIYF